VTWHIFKQSGISPADDITVNVRNSIDSDGPHMIAVGCRTVVAGGVGQTYRMYFEYETDNGELIIEGTNWTVMNDITQAGGAIWYRPLLPCVDKRYPLGDGPGADPYGTWTLNMQKGGGPGVPVGTTLISYEAWVITNDGNPTVVYHPAL
jgi:hypothetical protein